MPRRTDIHTILILGAGPIIIGQACEFDYSGVQACRALKEEGYRVVLVNSNPATIMTDPNLADRTYIEPVTWPCVAKVIEKEQPDALLPTMGGQTALNCALDLAREGVLERFNVELIGASQEAIDKAEDREQFDQAMKKIGLATPKSAIAHSLEEALQVQAQLGFPCVIRPSFTLGGSGGGIAYNIEEFIEICKRGLELSPTSELLIDESLLGWKEFEMEVVRDKRDNCIIVCSIENLDPMGVHTGDSITVAPAQTLTDKEYQRMRDASIAVLREIGVETGGSNVQFTVNPADGTLLVIEMNPRVSRSSALASKATGFPIAKIAAKLAIGYTLDELRNDITGGVIPASFEPTIDYVVTKIPRFNFEKFPQADANLTTQMKSVGEVMAIGRTFQESLQKAYRGLEAGYVGLDPQTEINRPDLKLHLKERLKSPTPERLLIIADAFRAGWSLADVSALTQVDPWFLAHIQDLITLEKQTQTAGSVSNLDATTLRHLKQAGFSDARLAQLLNSDEASIRQARQDLNIRPVFKRVDTCSGEFESDTAYLYSTYETECESKPNQRPKIMILGGGPNRIGQGIEFDYCCVHASFAAKEAGFEAIMVNCNPETVSTDYDISDRLYFDPITLENVLEIVDLEQPTGLIVQFGGQTPLKLAKALAKQGVKILGTSPDAIDRAEDRERFQLLVKTLGLLQPPNKLATSVEEGCNHAHQLGYPLVVRPSYVLGGQAMKVVFSEKDLRQYLNTAVQASHDCPVLLDHYLNNAIEVDVDAICDGSEVIIGGIMQHIEQAGIHSGDSACSIPPYALSSDLVETLRQQTRKIGLELGVIGLMNIQFAIQDEQVYLLEVNPRASRTVPFVSKSIGVSLANIAAKCMMGISLAEQELTEELAKYKKKEDSQHICVKESVFPFAKFPGVDPILGPEMKSTGEVMGIGETFSEAFLKAIEGSGDTLPTEGQVFISVKDYDKPKAIEVAQELIEIGFNLVATTGTAEALSAAGLAVKKVNKVKEGRPHIVDWLKNGEISLIINTTEGPLAIADSYEIRRTALQQKVYYTTTLSAAKAICMSLQYNGKKEVRCLQELYY